MIKGDHGLQRYFWIGFEFGDDGGVLIAAEGFGVVGLPLGAVVEAVAAGARPQAGEGAGVVGAGAVVAGVHVDADHQLWRNVFFPVNCEGIF